MLSMTDAALAERNGAIWGLEAEPGRLGLLIGLAIASSPWMRKGRVTWLTVASSSRPPDRMRCSGFCAAGR